MSDKVVSIQRKREERCATTPSEAKTKEELDAEAYFAEVEAKNKAKKERIAAENAKKNKSVLRDYRIKH